ncbi:TipJ family phage tail tip protein [Providencia hangzhouensis]|uniref:TipJ family phage tail tip protein n=1 Tax=Providencia hangzhouensis TaxID=3031799 RepID=UPI003F68F4BD
MRIQGAKGGSSKPRTPVEQKDSLLSESTAKILLALSEGEIAGGLDDTRIFLDDTPIANADGSKNFEGVTWEFRAGTEHQEYIQGIPSVDNEFSVGMELKDDQPYVRTINNLQLSALRIRLAVPQFMQQHDNGDTTGYRVDYVIELSTDGAGYKEVVKSAFDGKTTSEYQRTHRIDLPKANTGWQVRVRRLTKNQNNARIADRINVAAVAEVIDAKLRYPNTALLFITFNARQFNNRIPKISVRPKGGILVKVPTNYDPINRTYSGVWDGTFKLAATNNPAWVFYDLVLNNRYGCGDRIKASQVEKWDLYKIAQYCDELVPDGHGGDGKEPRFLCDVYIQSQESAYQVLRDIAAIFRGMTFWADNKVNAIADMPATIFRTFTNANIVGGKPSYSGGSIQNRYTQALVSFTNIDNHSNDDVEPIADLKLQRRYGVRKLELSAIGCTRRSEANRRGRWALLTNANDRMISFATGLEGAIPSPGHIIAVADSSLAGRNTGGRISSVEGRKITLDRTTSIKAGDRLIVNLPHGGSEGRTVTAVNKKVVTVSVEYSQVPQKEAVWVVDSDDLAVQLYRVINISDNGDNTYTINGTIHNPDNYDHIDSGARIDERPITVIPPNVQPAPKNVRISSYSQVDQGIAFTTLRVDWEAAESAIAYEAEWRRDNGNWINAPRTSTLGFEVNGIYAGRYQVRVRAINASEISSVWASAEETQLNGKEGNPPKPLNLRATSEVWGITLDWGFDVNTSDSLKTELQYSPENTAESMQLLADVPYPLKSYRMSGLKAGVRFYFRARLVDKSGNQSEWTSFVLGESSTDVEGILDAVGDKFLSTEAGQQMQEQIDFNRDNLTDLKIDSDDFRQKVISIDRELEAVNEAVMEVVHFSTENYWELKEESAKGKASIKQLEQVQADFTASQAKYQQEVAAQFEHTAADVLNVQNALAKSNEAFAEDIRQVRADLGETNDEVGTIKGRVTTVETATVDLKQAQAKQEQSVAAEFGEMRGYLTHLGQVTTDDNKALVEAIGQTQAQFLSLHNESLVSRARIIRTETALATETEARAEDKVQIDARFNDAEGAITTIKEVQAQQGEAIAKSEEQLRAEINLGDEALQGQLTEQGRELSEVSSVVTEHKSAIADLDKTVTQVKQTQQSQYNETKASINELSETTTSLDEAMATEKALTESRFEETEASISSLQQTVANIEGATVEAVGQLQVQHDIQGIEVLSVKASIRRVETVIATETHALAQKVEQLDAQYGDMNSSINSLQKVVADNQKSQAEVNELIKSEIGDNKAAIEKRAETSIDQQGNSRAYFSIKAGVLHNGQYYDVKMMMSAQVKNGQVVTQIAFAADEFIIFNNANGQFVTPFAVVNGQVFIGSGFIQDGSITNAKIGNVIQSNDFKKGEKGWQISKNGNPEFNDGTFRGKINATSGSFSNVVIEKNCDVKGTIYAENMKGNIVTVTKDIYINKSWQGTQVVELFKVMKRTQKCYVWVQGALNPTENIPSYTGVATPNRSALAYRAPRFIGQGGECDIYVDNVKQPRPITYNIDNTGDIRDTYAVNEFVVDVPAGEGAASIGISIPHNGGEWTRFIMRARVIVFPSTDEVTF